MSKKTRNDPTGQRGNRRRATSKLQKRLDRAMRKIIRDFRAMPKTRRSQKIIANASVQFYQYPTYDQDFIKLSIQSHLDAELETFRDVMPPDWWFKEDIEVPYRQGTMEEIVDINQQIRLAISRGVIVEQEAQQIEARSILFSSDYVDKLRKAEVRNYNLVKTLSENTAQQVLTEVTNGIESGLQPSEIRDLIVERFGVSKSNAKRIADTEINRAYNDARLDAVEAGNAQSDSLDVAVLHVSSLIATTRPTHRDRHGNAYTPQQQRKWWNTKPNRINCLCTTRSVVLDNAGNVLDSELTKKVKDMRNVNEQ